MISPEARSSIGMAFDTILTHKMRSLLTVLGVIIGTSTVIAVGSVITGVNSVIVGITQTFGPDTAFVFQFNLGFRGQISGEEQRRKPLTWEDAQAIAERCPSVGHVSPMLFPPNPFGGNLFERVRYKGQDVYQIQTRGTSESYAEAGAEKMLYGRFFTDQEDLHRLPVVVLGEDIFKALMPNEDPVGKQVWVDGQQFTVVGVMAKPAAWFPGQEDRRVMLPFFTMKKLFPNADQLMLVVAAKPGMLPRATDEMEAVLRQQRRLRPNQADNFWIGSGTEFVETFHQMTSTIALVMIVLSSIGLLVGGIGVMNIMLVSVTERTREIGIRKAVGAKQFDIMIQFLTEAVVLTGMGGLLGMLLGWLISVASHLVFPNLPTTVPLWAAALGIGVSVGVGLFFGIWPANRAARLDPVVALRYE
jgi:putative ABC transport system permease protein